MAVRIEAEAEPIPGYRLIDQIGAGGFGEVWKAEAPGGIFKAIKVIHGDMRSKDNDIVRYAEQELKALKRVQQVRHPYLLALDRYDIVDGRLMIVMELADCNLWDRFREYRNLGLPGIPRDELLLYLSEAAEVLDLFNDQFQLQHLDIKPQNLFLLYNHVKVADFGQVKDLEGLMATVTGGITPVYAAPETFDGIVTRYCDQYSLACVYQELLTGQRPFDGSSMSQLLMQHMNLPPNLQPSPPHDRPILARALSKKPEERWPTVSAFVRALIETDLNISRLMNTPHLSPSEHPTTLAPERRSGSHGNTQMRSPTAPLPRLVVPGTAGPTETPTPRFETEMSGSANATAPQEVTGPGPLRPSLIIGLGQAGLRVLQRLRFDLSERHGPPEMLPAIRTLFIDTDQDALDEAVKARPLDRLAMLAPDTVFPAKLNRATHYTKPRLSGRTLTDGWFDQQLIYKIPRGLQTGGMRILGRLAFLDHHRSLMTKVQSELEAALSADALARTEKRTGLPSRTNRPVVYIATGLCGGTGSGMFLDMAYSVRSRLQRMGYPDPEVIGVLMLPTADTTKTPPQVMANTFAALTELNHYSRPDTTFSANYEDRIGVFEDKAAPFTHCFVAPGNVAGLKLPTVTATNAVPQSRTPTAPQEFRTTRPGSGPLQPPQKPTEASSTLEALKPYGAVADLIRLNLFSEIGRTADEIRAIPADGAPPIEGVTVASFGVAGLGWPRAEVVARTTRKIAKLVLARWATTDPRRAREIIPALAQDKWTQLKFDADVILGRLQLAADIAGDRIEEQILTTADPLVPRGWLARLPEPGPVKVVIDRLVRLLGPPAAVMKQAPTAVEQALNKTVQETGTAFAAEMQKLIPALVNDSQYRLAGTEEMLLQFLTTTDRLIAQYLKSAENNDTKAQVGFERVSQYAHNYQGTRKPTVAEFGDAIKQFPRARFQALLSRAVVNIYQTVRETLAAKLADVKKARERLETAAQTPNHTVEVIDHLPGSGGPRLMPPGCDSVGAAVLRFVGVITDADLNEIDQRIHQVITPAFGSILQACSSSQTGPTDVVTAIYEETRAHLDMRLGRVDMSLMFAERYRTAGQAETAIAQIFQSAEPSWIGVGPWSTAEVTVAGCLCGPGGDQLHEVIQRAIPVPGLIIADTPDDLLLYREWPHVPLGVLTQLGPAAGAAYQSFADGPGGTVHSRLDVIRWMGADDV